MLWSCNLANFIFASIESFRVVCLSLSWTLIKPNVLYGHKPCRLSPWASETEKKKHNTLFENDFFFFFCFLLWSRVDNAVQQFARWWSSRLGLCIVLVESGRCTRGGGSSLCVGWVRRARPVLSNRVGNQRVVANLCYADPLAGIPVVGCRYRHGLTTFHDCGRNHHE